MHFYAQATDFPISFEKFFDLLSKYNKIDSGGSVRNNLRQRIDDKFCCQRNYELSIAFENSFKESYSTEKLYEVLLHTPYSFIGGNPMIAKEFNPKHSINIHDYPSLDAVVERVRELDNDSQQCLAVLLEPFFC